LYSENQAQKLWWTKSKQITGPLFAWLSEFRKSKIGLSGLVIAIIFILCALLAPVISTHDPGLRDADAMFQPPSWQHLFGTTALGQDVFSRLMYAGRISLFVGVVGSLGVVALGSTIGIFAGYFGGIIDELVTRIADIMLILPQLPLMIILAALMGPGMNTIFFVVIVLGWTHIYRQVRALTLSVKQYSFVEAAKAVGASHIHIMWYHILPNVLGIVIANFVLEVVLVIMLEAGLSFLGLGDPLHVSWGTMLYFSQTWGAFLARAWWWWLPPGLCIALLGMAFSFIGNTLNDRFVLQLKNLGKK